MALEEQLMGVVKGFVPSLGPGALTIGYVVFFGAVLLGLAYWYSEQRKYNKTVIVKRIGSNNSVKYYMDKARYFRDENGVDGWRLKGLKRKVHVPPDQAINISVTGGTVASCVVDSNQQITWLEDKVDYEKFKQGNTYEPISSESKANYAYQLQYNKKLRSYDWMKDNASLIVGGMTLVMLVAVVLFFLPKTFEAYSEANNGVASAADSMRQSMDKLDEIWTNQQRIIEQQQRGTGGVVVSEEGPG